MWISPLQRFTAKLAGPRFRMARPRGRDPKTDVRYTVSDSRPARIRRDRSEIVRHPRLRRSLVQRLIWSKKATSSLTVHQRARNPLQPATCIASIGLQVEVRLKVGLVQDWVGYFDEVDPGNAFTAMVAVEHVSATPVPPDVTPPRVNVQHRGPARP